MEENKKTYSVKIKQLINGTEVVYNITNVVYYNITFNDITGLSNLEVIFKSKNKCYYSNCFLISIKF